MTFYKKCDIIRNINDFIHFFGGYLLELLLYGALLLAQLGTSGKQFAMKKCGAAAPGPFNSVCINMMRSLICLTVSVIIWLIADGSGTTLLGHILIIVSGVGTALSLFTWILASRLVSLTLIECLSMIGTLLLPIILAPYLYDGDTVSIPQWIGCLLVFASVFMFMNKSDGKKKEGKLWQKILIVSVFVVGITLSTITKKYYTYTISQKGLGTVEYFTFINFVTVLLVFLLLFAVYYLRERNQAAKTENGRIELPYKKVWVYILIAAASLYLNELFTVYASQLPSAIYYPLSKGLIVGCSFLLDVAVFKEKVTGRKLIGLITVIIAIILVNF